MERFSKWDALRWFKPSEFKEPEKMSTELLMLLDRARQAAGIPFRITSCYRPGDDGAHGEGKAVDIRVDTSTDRLRIVRAVLEAGFQRVGVYDSHIHVDVSRRLTRGVLWTGRSK